MRYLVTGSSGYIGSHLTVALQRQGHTVRGYDRRPPSVGRPDEFVHADLLDERQLPAALADVDVVCHLAAAKDDWGITDAQFFRDNLEVTQALLAAGERAAVQRWLFASTVAVFGPSARALDESGPTAPVDAYGESKLLAEREFEAFARRMSSAQVTVLRPSVVFGPDNPDYTNIYRLIDAIHRRRFVMVGDGSTLKSTSYLGNLVPATIFLLDRFVPGVQMFVYVDEPVLTTEELVTRIHRMLGRKRRGFRLPLPLARRVAKGSDWVASTFGVNLPITSARIQKFCTPTNYDGSAIRTLGFEEPYDHDTALQATVDWYLAR